MRILVVSRFKENFPSHILPFVEEQGEALRGMGNEVDYFQVRGSYFSAKELNERVSLFRPDIIHAHYGLSAITAVLQSKVPVVTTFHNGEVSSLPLNCLCSVFSLRAAHVIYVAEHIYRKAVFKRKDRHSIIPCGVNLDECVVTPFQQARTLCGFAPDRKYVIFGGAFSNLRKNYPLLAEGIGVSGRNDIEVIEMKGLSRKELSLLMSACDVFALPSKDEGSPQALKEAMACGCPIVASGIADIRHLLGDLPGHFICDFTPESVASCLNQAIAFNGRTRGRERIVELGLENKTVARKLMAIYKEVLK